LRRRRGTVGGNEGSASGISTPSSRIRAYGSTLKAPPKAELNRWHFRPICLRRTKPRLWLLVIPRRPLGVGDQASMRQSSVRAKKARVATGRATVAYLPIASIVTDPSNPRKHSPEQVRAIGNSIEAFGFNAPILIDKANRIVAGHGPTGSGAAARV